MNQWKCTEHQARAAIELRLIDGILAFPTSFRGNQSIDRDKIEKIFNFYCHDGISRPSPNRKDVVSINGVSNNVTLNDLIGSVVCDVNNEDCSSRACSHCSSPASLSSLLIDDGTDEEEDVSWTVWKTIKNNVMLQTISGSELKGIRKYHEFDPQLDETISWRTISMSTEDFQHNHER
ncbi:unnamed protein product [Rotaria socialis]|uniref:Uncharacterized protein n=1 Tax=Rotaria socialis TaxID=392032 RepID=A0A821UEZ8_9BILA|nr:unnamed protein product [Rotaria socialis]CAF4444908.1 unnamed protein product [Rotaria socialis]CAF4664640.1 unnamed protein product [Rotaria socialis]CAF4889191.1 unnamed protein product [Rotaria socialis]